MHPAPIDHRRFWLNPLTVIFGTIVLFLGSQFFGSVLLSILQPLLPTNNQQIAVFVGINFAVLLVMLSIAFKLSGFSWRSVGYSKPNFKALLSVIPAFIIYFVISTVLTLLAIRFIPGFKVDQTQDIGFQDLHSTTDLIAAFISLIVLTPIFEETVFRGVLFRGLRNSLNFWPCAILVSIIFAAAHWQWNVAVDTFALSIILCVLAERSKSIVPSILLHAAKNSVAFIFLFILK